MRSTAELIRELQVLRLVDPFQAAILELELNHRVGTTDTEGFEPRVEVLYADPSAIF